MNTIKKAKRLGVCLTVLLFVTGCNDFKIGDSVEITNTKGLCGEYLGYKGAHIVRGAADGYLYAVSSDDYNQKIVVVDTCDK